MSAILNTSDSLQVDPLTNDAGAFCGGFFLGQAPGEGVGITMRDVLLQEIKLLAGPTTVRLPLLVAYLRGHVDASSVQVYGVSQANSASFLRNYEVDMTTDEMISEIDFLTDRDDSKLRHVVDILKQRVNNTTVAV